MNTTQNSRRTVAGVAVLAAVGLTYIATNMSSLRGLRGDVISETAHNTQDNLSCNDIHRTQMKECFTVAQESQNTCYQEYKKCREAMTEVIHDVFVCDARKAACGAIVTATYDLCVNRSKAANELCKREEEKPKVCKATYGKIIAGCNTSYETSVNACDTQYPSSDADAYACKQDAKSVFTSCTQAAEEAKVKCIKEPTQEIPNTAFQESDCRIASMKGLKLCNETKDTKIHDCRKKFAEETKERKDCIDLVEAEKDTCYELNKGVFNTCMSKLTEEEPPLPPAPPLINQLPQTDPQPLVTIPSANSTLSTTPPDMNMAPLNTQLK